MFVPLYKYGDFLLVTTLLDYPYFFQVQFFFVNVFMKIRGYDCCYEGSENLCHSNGFVLVLSSESSTHLPYTCKQ